MLDDNLSSAVGIDYRKLRNLLADGKWEKADRETAAVMLEVNGRKKGWFDQEKNWLDLEHIENFPCTDLQTIDQLWLKYSNGRFGFSVQKHIWQSLGGKPEADYETWHRFLIQVGWTTVSPNRLKYSNLTFALSAPIGHLPLVVFSLTGGYTSPVSGMDLRFFGISVLVVVGLAILVWLWLIVGSWLVVWFGGFGSLIVWLVLGVGCFLGIFGFAYIIFVWFLFRVNPRGSVSSGKNGWGWLEGWQKAICYFFSRIDICGL